MTTEARPGQASEAAEGRLAGWRFLRTFEGVAPTPGILAAIAAGRTSGVTLFRRRNVASPGQLRELAAALQAARPHGDPPLVIGLDQEGGQLQAVGYGATAWPGNLALGAAGSEELARRAGAAIGAEAAAMGATLVFAPVCDVLQPESATPLGTRSFGSDPARVARLAAAMTRGLQESGVAAALKHFPGHGAAVGDSHLAMPVVGHDRAALEAIDLPPFQAGIAAGAKVVLPAHLAAPALTGGLPELATVSPRILRDILRAELEFEGVTVSDAMNMGGAGAEAGLMETVLSAAAAGIDLLLMVHPAAVEDAAVEALAEAIRAGRLDATELRATDERILRLRRGFEAIDQPPLSIVGCHEHRALAAEIARASISLVGDPLAILPLDPARIRRLVLIAAAPIDLTPAETSSYLTLGLAAALRERGLAVDELVAPLDPTPAEVAALACAAADHDAAIVGTFDAVTFPGQAALVEAVASRLPCVAVALRSPYDAGLVASPAAAVCSFGIQQPQMAALADALLGRIEFAGRLPVVLPASSTTSEAQP